MPLNEHQKSRGRPRVPEEERKRHTLTFRMRKDLRDAVEELADANGRTLSEQVEYYVDAAVFSEASLIYKYSTESMSETLRRCISNRLSGRDNKDDAKLSVDFPVGHREMLTVQGQICLNHPHTESSLPWACAPGGREDAIATARTMLDAIKKGAVDALVSTLGSEAVEAVLAEERKAAFAAEAQAALTNLGRSHAAQMPSPATSPPEGDHSLAALVALIGSLTALSPDLSVLDASSWPRQFVDLPPDTRAGLIEALADDAPSVYETLMLPTSPRRSTKSGGSPIPDYGRGRRMGSLRQMQEMLLPAEQGGQGESRIRDRG